MDEDRAIEALIEDEVRHVNLRPAVWERVHSQTGGTRPGGVGRPALLQRLRLSQKLEVAAACLVLVAVMGVAAARGLNGSQTHGPDTGKQVADPGGTAIPSPILSGGSEDGTLRTTVTMTRMPNGDWRLTATMKNQSTAPIELFYECNNLNRLDGMLVKQDCAPTTPNVVLEPAASHREELTIPSAWVGQPTRSSVTYRTWWEGKMDHMVTLVVMLHEGSANTDATCPHSGCNPAEARLLKELTGLPPDPSALRWSPDGKQLLYEGGGVPHGVPFILSLMGAEPPKSLGVLPTFVPPVWAPDGQAIAFAGPRTEPDGSAVTTLYLQSLAGGEPVDLLPGALAKRGVSGTKWPDRWIDKTVLAYQEAMGTGIRELRFVNTETRKLVELPTQLNATTFHWSDDGSMVAGQLQAGIPARFWVWDVGARKFLTPTAPLPGKSQWFESWAGNDRVLFTSGDAYPGSQGAGSTGLYRFHVKNGAVVQVTVNAAAAVASGDHLVYVREGLTLVVANMDGKVVWEDSLGSAADGTLSTYRPQVAGKYVVYHTAFGEWILSPLAAKQPVMLRMDAQASAALSPDGRYIAVSLPDKPGRMQILANPFESK